MSYEINCVGNSILLHSGLNPACHLWFSTRLSCCLKMKSVENILGYVREQFYRFSRDCKPRENLWNCLRTYTEMFKTDSFLGNKKLSFNQNVWRDHVTMQQDVLLHFRGIFSYHNQAEIWKNILMSSSMQSFFIVYPHFFIVYPCGQQWGYMEKCYKLQKTKWLLIIAAFTYMPRWHIK